MKASLRYLHFPDVDSPEENLPSVPDHLPIPMQAMIGPRDSEGEESFEFIVCTPRWIETKVGELKHLFGRHLLIVDRYDYVTIARAIEGLCNIHDAPDWPSLASRLGEYGAWEFHEP